MSCVDVIKIWSNHLPKNGLTLLPFLQGGHCGAGQRLGTAPGVGSREPTVGGHISLRRFLAVVSACFPAGENMTVKCRITHSTLCTPNSCSMPGAAHLTCATESPLDARHWGPGGHRTCISCPQELAIDLRTRSKAIVYTVGVFGPRSNSGAQQGVCRRGCPGDSLHITRCPPQDQHSHAIHESTHRHTQRTQKPDRTVALTALSVFSTRIPFLTCWQLTW